MNNQVTVGISPVQNRLKGGFQCGAYLRMVILTKVFICSVFTSENAYFVSEQI